MVDRSSTSHLIKQDADRYLAVWNRRPGLGQWLRLLLLTPGFQLGLSLRFQALIGRVPIFGRVLRRMVWYVTTLWFGCDINPQAQFGGGLFLPHPLGIVIDGNVRVGRNVAILHGVTLGRREEGDDAMLLVGDDVEIGAGAKIIGAFGIGAGARIGANAVVLGAVPAGMIAVGVPARVKPSRRARAERHA